MNRSPMPRPRKPMRQISEKRLAKLGGYVTSTFAPSNKVKNSATKSQSRPQPAVPVDVRTALKQRAGEGGWCEAQLPGCFGKATDPHHRIPRGAGGVHGEAKERADRMSDLIYLCRSCHHFAHTRTADAREFGLLLKKHQNPAMEPVFYRGEPSYLDDAGRVWTAEEVGA